MKKLWIPLKVLKEKIPRIVKMYNNDTISFQSLFNWFLEKISEVETELKESQDECWSYTKEISNLRREITVLEEKLIKYETENDARDTPLSSEELDKMLEDEHNLYRNKY